MRGYILRVNLKRNIISEHLRIFLRKVVDSPMLVQLGALFERFVALIAAKGLLACVGSQVVEHIALLGEFLLAMAVSAD